MDPPIHSASSQAAAGTGHGGQPGPAVGLGVKEGCHIQIAPGPTAAHDIDFTVEGGRGGVLANIWDGSPRRIPGGGGGIIGPHRLGHSGDTAQYEQFSVGDSHGMGRPISGHWRCQAPLARHWLVDPGGIQHPAKAAATKATRHINAAIQSGNGGVVAGFRNRWQHHPGVGGGIKYFKGCQPTLAGQAPHHIDQFVQYGSDDF